MHVLFLLRRCAADTGLHVYIKRKIIILWLMSKSNFLYIILTDLLEMRQKFQRKLLLLILFHPH